MKQVRVSRKGADRIRSGHLWIFASDVEDRGEAEGGEAVQVVDPRGQQLGVAHYSAASQIALRMLSRDAREPDRQFFRRRLARAIEHRRRVVRDSEAYRLVFSEGDLLPGLIVDRYGDYLVLQTLNQGMERAKPILTELLVELLGPRGILERNDAQVRQKEQLPLVVSALSGEVPERVWYTMHGLRFQADLVRGQKTGAYLDQRENYLAVREYARDKALDCFTATGGFALHLARQCESVEAVDTSELALELAEAARKENGLENVHFRKADVFELLSSYVIAGRRFSLIVLDPPAFARSRSGLDGAARGYKDINLRALKLLEPGGILVSCSCSQHVSEAMLLEIIAEAALDAGRTVRVLERRTQSRDHPILLTVPETHYLKCLILEVI
ncbi:MAG: class I SAM-dependent rRNA methyltransferase [Bryobacterales bacterium]|nr:class I SAM-dependent rRNA methyltransferase [Bryobacteraceae bacterium]MDW8130270.1 class I SAM-dependent rRNA methyltransferase [Bryobacterales bacterium]